MAVGAVEWLPDENGDYQQYTTGRRVLRMEVIAVIDSNDDAAQLLAWQTARQALTVTSGDGTATPDWTIQSDMPIRATVIRDGFQDNLRVRLTLEKEA